MPTDTPVTRLALATKTLGHPARLRILAMLRHNKLSVCQIASVLDVAPSTASGYLTELRRAGLVTEGREGKWVYYRLSDEDPNAALLRFVLVLIASDPQLGRDAASAERLSGTSPETLCASVAIDVEAPDWTTADGSLVMDWRREWKWLVLGVAAFAAIVIMPVGTSRFDGAVLEALYLLRWYAREHVVLCLVPAFFIAGAITVFVSQASVMKYLGAGANKVPAYAVASVSGTVLAVCSCTVLPLFAGIYKRGAGLGPATAFLYSGPAINVLAIVLTARVLGWRLGVARAAGAIVFSVVIGLIMHALFRVEEQARTSAIPAAPVVAPARTLGQEVTYFASLVGILVFANWAEPDAPWGFWSAVFDYKWVLTAGLGLGLAIVLVRWFALPLTSMALVTGATLAAAFAMPALPLVAFTVAIVGLSAVASRAGGDATEWFSATWDYAKQITPLLLGGVLLAGLLLGRPGHEGLIPSEWVSRAVGGNSVAANLFASLAGAFMYFATLTEVPIVQGLVGSGMGQGPALALLLAGPALSLPSILVIRSVLGSTKTLTYVLLVVVMATVTGMVFGAWS